MSEPVKTAPNDTPKKPVIMCGHDSADQSKYLAKAIEDFVAALGKVFGGKDEDETPAEPSALVSIRKTTSIVEFDAEALARTAVKTAGAIFGGFKWPKPSQEPEAEVKVDPDVVRQLQIQQLRRRVAQRTVPKPAPSMGDFASTSTSPFASDDFTAFEGPDGRLKGDFVGAILGSLLSLAPSPGAGIPKVVGYAEVAELVKKYAPEKHREQILKALQAHQQANEAVDKEFGDSSSSAPSGDKIAEAIRGFEEASAKIRATKPPIVTPPPTDARPDDLTPDGHKILLVKTLDEKALKALHPGERERCVEIQVDVGDHRPPAAFRGTTKEDAAIRADMALGSGRSYVEEAEGKADDELHYEGDMRDASNPTSLDGSAD